MQEALLEQAAAQLRNCATLEAALFSMAQPPQPAGKRRRPQPPLLLSRTTDSLVISNPPLALRGPAATTFAVFCKPFGAGVAVGADRTAAEHAGTGVRTPLGGSATVTGLRRNETYMFAVAAYTAEGHLIGEIGAPPLNPAAQSRWLWSRSAATGVQLRGPELQRLCNAMSARSARLFR